MTRSDKEQLLSKIEMLVQQKFFDPNFNGKNWHELVTEHRTAIVDSQTTQQFEQAVTDLLSELNTSGLGLLGKDTRITPRNSIAASFRKVNTRSDGERWVFQDVQPGGVADKAGVKPGDALISIAGKEVFTGEPPAFEMGASIPIITARNGNRHERHLELITPTPKYKDNPYAEPDSAVVRRVENGIGDLKVSLFPGKIGIDFANHLNTLFSTSLDSANRLVIDLRGNPGGGIGNVRLMSFLTSAKQPIGYSLDRKTADRGYDRAKLPRFDRIPSSKLEIAMLALRYGGKKSVVLQTEGLGPKPFHHRVVILVNEHTTGAAEMVTLFAQENRLATIVGTQTPGRLVARSAFKIGHDYRLTIPIAAYISWDGQQIEGRGIQPDVPIDWSYEAALENKDVQMQKALEVAKGL